MENKKKASNTILKDALALFGITLIAGLILGLVYQTTKEPIEAANLAAKQEAYQKVYQEASGFEADDTLTKAVADSTAFLEKNKVTGAVLTEALLAKNDKNETIGYVLALTAKEGYSGDITMTMGLDLEGVITGLEILSNKETAGLGARCTEPVFKNQYIGINADQVIVTKTGKKAENEIDAISGATITSSAVTKAVNAGIAFVKQDDAIAQKE